jgi:hypothetical protein
MPYAEGTKVTVSKSRDEIERTLQRFNASQLMWMRNDDTRVVTAAFKRQGRSYKFEVPLPWPQDFLMTTKDRYGHSRRRTESQVKAALEQEERRLFRSLALFVKAILEGVESGIVKFDEVMLPFAILADGSTVAQRVLPQMEERGDVDLRLALPPANETA